MACFRYGDLPEISSKKTLKMAGFDMNETLITPKSGGTFAKHEKDFIFFPKMLKLLKQLDSEGYAIVIFTNQKFKGKTLDMQLNLSQNVVKAIQKKIGVSVLLYSSTEDDEYRKPNPGMFEQLQEDTGFKRLRKASFYTGDADGSKHAFSDSDRVFAENIGVQFLTIKEVYDTLLEESDSEAEESDSDSKEDSKEEESDSDSKEDSKEDSESDSKEAKSEEKLNRQIYIMIGAPGSGKDYFIKHNLRHHTAINRDDCKTVPACIKKIQAILKEDPDAKIVVNATNPSRKARADWITFFRSYGIKDIGGIFMNIPKEICKERNVSREKRVPVIAITMFYKNFQEPEKEEGFREIVEVRK